MIPIALKTQFDEVLQEERLYDVAAVFGDPDFFDEVPLYSRYKQVEFLARHGNVDALLVELSLAYLERVATEVRLRSKRLVAITVTRDDDDYIVPAIFVCNRDVKTRLAQLHLSSSLSAFGKDVDTLVRKARSPKPLMTCEDDETAPDYVRVFIGYKSPPKGFVSLELFGGNLQAHRRVG